MTIRSPEPPIEVREQKELLPDTLPQEEPRRSGIRALFQAVGPGLVTGAADDDPSGIATATQAGAQFGYGLLWTVLLAYPLMIAVQEACARIGAVTGQGLAGAIRQRYSRPVLLVTVTLVACANTINIGADLEGMSAALNLVVPIPIFAASVGLATLTVALEIFVSYRAYARILKWLSLSLLSYLVVALIIEEPWSEILRDTVIPQIDLNSGTLILVVGLLGTTISPYMFFWEASEEVEESLPRRQHRSGQGRNGPLLVSRAFMRSLRIDNILGMAASQITTWFIVVAGATVLHANGITNISTAADAAKALEPLVQTFPQSGTLAKLLFAIGVLGLGLLAIPVLAGSSAYAVSETMGWHEGLSARPGDAPGFYSIIVVSTVVGVAMHLIGVNPVKALIFAAVFNGVAAVPLLYLVGRIAADEAIMGEWSSRRLSRTLLLSALAVMGLAALALFFSLTPGR